MHSVLGAGIESIGARFHLNMSSLEGARGVNEVATLSELQNMALAPLDDRDSGTLETNSYSSDAIVTFMNDVVLCTEDELELCLLCQHVSQSAHMTRVLDWIISGFAFYDVWISRSMAGNLFLEIPQDASWSYKDKLFWGDPASRVRYEVFKPLQAYSCWGKMVSIGVAPFVTRKLILRRTKKGGWYLVEATLLAKDHAYREEPGRPSRRRREDEGAWRI